LWSASSLYGSEPVTCTGFLEAGISPQSRSLTRGRHGLYPGSQPPLEPPPLGAVCPPGGRWPSPVLRTP
jgi:hypothetical protein